MKYKLKFRETVYRRAKIYEVSNTGEGVDCYGHFGRQ